MTFLKKLGSVIREVGKYAGLLSGTAQMMFPGKADEIEVISADLVEVANIVVIVEAIGQTADMAGEDKLRVAGPLVADAIVRSALVAGRKIDNPALFAAGSTKIADGMADILNSLKDDIETESLT